MAMDSSAEAFSQVPFAMIEKVAATERISTETKPVSALTRWGRKRAPGQFK